MIEQSDNPVEYSLAAILDQCKGNDISLNDDAWMSAAPLGTEQL